MVWYCNKHKRHSIDDVCFQCDEDAIQPQVDAWLAGWDARHNLYSSDASHEKRDEQLSEFKNTLRHGRLKGSHEA
jgi:hypothetical protein